MRTSRSLGANSKDNDFTSSSRTSSVRISFEYGGRFKPGAVVEMHSLVMAMRSRKRNGFGGMSNTRSGGRTREYVSRRRSGNPKPDAEGSGGDGVCRKQGTRGKATDAETSWMACSGRDQEDLMVEVCSRGRILKGLAAMPRRMEVDDEGRRESWKRVREKVRRVRTFLFTRKARKSVPPIDTSAHPPPPVLQSQLFTTASS